MKKRFYILLIPVVIVICSFGPSIMVNTETSDQTKVQILPGNLDVEVISSPNNFSTHDNQSYIYANFGEILITDATGSGKGWHLQVESSPVTVHFDDGTYETIPKDKAKIELSNEQVMVTSNGSTLPQLFQSNFIPLNDGQPVTLLTAKRDEGMGITTVQFPNDSLRIQVPETDRSVEYDFTLTWHIQQGP
ncbi:WxL domain-containing protein [Salirhabdus salicampi]|uniref:WxL domain-containing protein n=1 Tax=Salirhabdus salicampi TaxID=476102 RepID=UPI0020C2E98A|nr:WxL domain-containing protein [Salirhabdus salicampi]MCP8615732.1 WxL domain-containing protein [Salirhabdus salicampi]